MVPGAWYTALRPLQDCLLCGADAGNALLCHSCHTNLPHLPSDQCPVCALPSSHGMVCGHCLRHPPFFDATCASFHYAFPINRLIQAFKYQHHLVIADFFATELIHALAACHRIPATDLLLALPLAPHRIRDRGFNQAIEIARLVARHRPSTLVLDGYDRRINRVPQTRLPWSARQKNVRGIFECSLDLDGKSILVIDDVMTTGATLNEFARTLKHHGAKWVGNAVVARATRR